MGQKGKQEEDWDNEREEFEEGNRCQGDNNCNECPIYSPYRQEVFVKSDKMQDL